MTLDDQDWRPITFQGVTFPPTLMGISVLEPILKLTEREMIDWVLGLPVCCGIKKRAPAEVCARCARQTIDLMLDHRFDVLEGIRTRLGPHGFEPEATYRDWFLAMQQILELSKRAEDECVWSAPRHPNDMTKADLERLNAALDKKKAEFEKGGDI